MERTWGVKRLKDFAQTLGVSKNQHSVSCAQQYMEASDVAGRELNELEDELAVAAAEERYSAAAALKTRMDTLIERDVAAAVVAEMDELLENEKCAPARPAVSASRPIRTFAFTQTCSVPNGCAVYQAAGVSFAGSGLLLDLQTALLLSSTTARDTWFSFPSVLASRYAEAATLRDAAATSVLGWFVGRGQDDPHGHLLRVSTAYNRYMGHAFSARDISAAKVATFTRPMQTTQIRLMLPE